MRPLLLGITAFGPYGGHEEVDFTRLPADRPFVISGDTGSGKTSIFDAMTWALYGCMPGQRAGHGDVRSTHADPSVLCEVSFEFAADGNRWRVTRVPTQRRAKRRGTGFTDEKAAARLEVLRGGDWEPTASRITEVDHRCRELVGLTAEQFQRVVLLPQGEFQRVLHAGTAERESLLRTLFGTQVFAEAITRAVDESRGLWSRLEGSEVEVRTHLDHVRSSLDAAVRAAVDAGVSVPDRGLTTGAPEEVPLRADADSGADSDGAEVSPDVGVDTEALRARLELIRSGAAADLSRSVEVASAGADEAAAALTRAEGVAIDLAMRDRRSAELAALDGDPRSTGADSDGTGRVDPRRT